MPVDLSSKDLIDGFKELAKEAGKVAGNKEQAENWVAMADKVLGIVKEANSLFDKFQSMKANPAFVNPQRRPSQSLGSPNMDGYPENKTIEIKKESEVIPMSIENIDINMNTIFATGEAMLQQVSQDEKLKALSLADFLAQKLPENIRKGSVEDALKFMLSNRYMTELVIKDFFNKNKAYFLVIKNV